ncbi:VOC family protein [Terrilactibacillus laevilacticus]|uniref:VOC family protein n=1 Tax=Terrilactibacillus laevilacticus TaxID=1380157 RepID=A0ABW5PUL5_9BACI|nr:VOC family protein [Terrilactibacillus laevilacticus]
MYLILFGGLMKRIIPHIMIENCKEATRYYHSIFGGEIKNTQLSDGIEMFKGQEGKYIHAELHINNVCVLYFADIFNSHISQGSQIQLALDLESESEIRTLYEALAKDGQIKMELQETFWGATFGVVLDKYGVTWELNYQKE